MVTPEVCLPVISTHPFRSGVDLAHSFIESVEIIAWISSHDISTDRVWVATGSARYVSVARVEGTKVTPVELVQVGIESRVSANDRSELFFFEIAYIVIVGRIFLIGEMAAQIESYRCGSVPRGGNDGDWEPLGKVRDGKRCESYLEGVGDRNHLRGSERRGVRIQVEFFVNMLLKKVRIVEKIEMRYKKNK